MAEKIVSAGVFTRENDLSFLPAGIGAIGAAVVGPTVKGPAGIPTLVTSYGEYVEKFGNTFTSGSDSYQFLSSHMAERYLQFGGALTVVRVTGDNPATAEAKISTGSATTPADGLITAPTFDAIMASANNQLDRHCAFSLHTLSHGLVMNSTGSEGTNNLLVNGSADNLRWEVTGVNNSTGTFTVLIRKGNDTHANKQVLETWNGVSLDPKATNYIGKIIGDSVNTVRGTASDPYIQSSGSYKTNSSYVRVEVHNKTVDFLDDNGNIRVSAASSSLPLQGSGSFAGGSNGQHIVGGGIGDNTYELGTASNVQGLNYGDITNTAGGANVAKALTLLSNQDFYDINMIVVPGANQKDHAGVIDKAIKTCESRGDCFTIVDPVGYGQTVTVAANEAPDYNSSYAAMYWPWVEVADNQLGKNVWVPPSVVMPGVLAYNDSVAAEWYAPAGLNRGGISAIKAERNLTHTNRDTLYEARVNPIATFPGIGVCAWGQKTLQKRASALDRINVRRLLINLKKFIASTTKYLVFEQNTLQTRNRFLATVIPYMESVQNNQGLYAFRVVMDESNNTPDVVDRNIMKGDIFIQPAKAAEFIIVDFNIMPTGATFND
jgi:hypothetical protein